MKQYESERLILRTPTLEDEKMIWDYRQEFVDNNEQSCGDSGLLKASSFEDWYNHLQLMSNKDTLPPNRVVATQFMAIEKTSGTLVGMVNVRHYLTPLLLSQGGHIGDSVRKSKRNQGYATEQIGTALVFCKDRGINKVLMTCNKDNIGSMKSIVKNGGVKENEIIVDGKIMERYWIDNN